MKKKIKDFRLSAERLKRMGACETAVRLFKKHYGTRKVKPSTVFRKALTLKSIPQALGWANDFSNDVGAITDREDIDCDDILGGYVGNWGQASIRAMLKHLIKILKKKGL